MTNSTGETILDQVRDAATLAGKCPWILPAEEIKACGKRARRDGYCAPHGKLNAMFRDALSK